jgi:hypothetical protein
LSRHSFLLRVYLLSQILVVLLEVANLHSALVKLPLKMRDVLLCVKVLELKTLIKHKSFVYLDGVDNLLQYLMGIVDVTSDSLQVVPLSHVEDLSHGFGANNALLVIQVGVVY